MAVPGTAAMTVSNLSSRTLSISLASCLTCFLLLSRATTSESASDSFVNTLSHGMELHAPHTATVEGSMTLMKVV